MKNPGNLKLHMSGTYPGTTTHHKPRNQSLINIILTVFFIIIFNAASSAEETSPLPFSEIIEANTGIRSIDAEIVQHVNTPEHGREVFKGRYIADDRGRFRIDYTAPSKQIVLNNGASLYWYFHDDNVLYIIGNNAVPNKPKINPLQEFKQNESGNQFKINYMGKHFYGFFNSAHQYIVDDVKNKLSFNIMIDAKNKALLSKIITDSAGVEIMKEIYEDYKKIKNINFPSRIDIYARTDKGITRNITIYSGIRLNYSVDEKLFKAAFPADAKKKYLQQ
ncbi:MAG: DUF4292 domain-containing protein [Spirochaetota bacterium]